MSEYQKIMDAFIDHKEAFMEHKAEMKSLSKEVVDIRKTMEQIGQALQKIAVLEEHKHETKKDLDDLFTRMRQVETQSAVTGSKTKANTDIIQRVLIWIILAGLAVWTGFK